MKKTLSPFLIITLIVIISSCSSVKYAGDLTIISTRNVSVDKTPKKLGVVTFKNKRETRKFKAVDLKQAVDLTLKKYQGDFITNARIYLIGGRYYSVEGDIWGY